jgi:carbamoyltransferase
MSSEGNTFVLGINSAYHESAAAIFKDGELLAFVEEERFNRIKHAKSAKVNNPDLLPWDAINYCLETAKVDLGDIDYFAYSFNPEDRLTHNVDLKSEKELIENSWGTQKGEKLFYRKLRTIPNKISKKANKDIGEKFIFVPHHIAHAASSFYPSEFKKAALLVVDGIAEFAAVWTGKIEGGQIEKIDEILYPNSLGFVWEKFSEYLGFSEYDAAKVMGLSAYGESYKFREHFDKIIKLSKDGRFKVNNRYLQFRTGKFDSLEKLFKERKRSPEKHIFAIHENIAATLQEKTEEMLINLARNLYQKTKLDNLCYSGGLALNCVANPKILEKSEFKNIYIQPAANDAGTALGAGYYVWHNLLKGKRCNSINHAYWGPEFSNREIKEILKKSGLVYRKVRNIEKVVADLLSKGYIIGWFQGRMETGPRALGNRSILADPRSPVIRDDLNRKVKFREIFRPLCPSVLSEEACEWFQTGKSHLSPMDYMLMAIKIKKGKEKIVPAIVHVDNTCRIQTVIKKTNPRFYKLIKEFKDITGIPIILNTSFNIREPIVCSPQDAVNTFKKSQIDSLAIGDYLVDHPSA